MTNLQTAEDAEIYAMALNAIPDAHVVQAYKDASERLDEKAMALCLIEMKRRNLSV